MIGSLNGIVDFVADSKVIVNVNGVGWEVNYPGEDLVMGTETHLFTYTQMTENAITLWGFKSREELSLFRKLLSVSGVGGRTASNLIYFKGISEIINAVKNNTAAALKISGVGAKTAEKIIIELKGKISELERFADGKPSNSSMETGLSADVKEALESLGYNKMQIDKALNSIEDITKFEKANDLIKELLKRM